MLKCFDNIEVKKLGEWKFLQAGKGGGRVAEGPGTPLFNEPDPQ